ncbi:MAG: type II methionyl aminopeptidase [Candidatus Thermoplasmatota archaeon]|nr:type II methionyl aminopeptidase [Candidatus Thermoplasmatota archaeon]
MDWLELQREACVAAARARDKGAGLVREGAQLLDVAQAIEEKIMDEGAKPAFPVNISINDIAAHYTPRRDDHLCFMKGDVVKLDVGAHRDGYIGDTATTVEVGTSCWSRLLRASEEALEKAIEITAPGISTADIGGIISGTIASHGYKPIENLTGHGLKRYNLHSEPSIPNIKDGAGVVLGEGMVVAIEPFATNGHGYVEGGPNGNIYRLVRERTPKNSKLVPLYDEIRDRFGSLPFAERWVEGGDDLALRKLTRYGVVAPYSILIEAGGGVVSQKEHTLYITSSGSEVLTR